MKKIITLFICLLLLFTLSACASSSSEPEPDFEDEMSGMEDEGFPEDPGPALSNTHNQTLVAAFTPAGAYIHSDVESMLVLESKQSMSEMIAFCLEAAENLGIELSDIDETLSDLWIYNGTLGDLTIHIELRDDGDSVNLMLLY